MSRYEYFCWDHRETAPLGAIIKAFKAHPDWKLYTWDNDTDVLEVVLAESVVMAKKAYQELNEQMIAEITEEEGKFRMPRILLWKD